MKGFNISKIIFLYIFKAKIRNQLTVFCVNLMINCKPFVILNESLTCFKASEITQKCISIPRVEIERQNNIIGTTFAMGKK